MIQFDEGAYFSFMGGKKTTNQVLNEVWMIDIDLKEATDFFWKSYRCLESAWKME